jgi:hypothetical protein
MNIIPIIARRWEGWSRKLTLPYSILWKPMHDIKEDKWQIKTLLARLSHVIWCLPCVSSIRHFGSVIPLFFNHTPDISVSENNRITLPKSRMKDTQDKHQITCNNRHSQVVKNTLNNSRTMHLTSSCEMHRSQTGDA